MGKSLRKCTNLPIRSTRTPFKREERCRFAGFAADTESIVQKDALLQALAKNKVRKMELFYTNHKRLPDVEKERRRSVVPPRKERHGPVDPGRKGFPGIEKQKELEKKGLYGARRLPKVNNMILF